MTTLSEIVRENKSENARESENEREREREREREGEGERERERERGRFLTFPRCVPVDLNKGFIGVFLLLRF